MTAQTQTKTITQGATAVRTRTRATRAVDLAATNARPEYEAALREFVAANAEKNAAASREKKAKTALERAMAKAEIDEFSMMVGTVMYDVTFKPGTKDEINVAALFKKMDLDKFLAIVSTSQAKIKEAAGSNVLAAVLDEVATDAAVKVEKRKD